MEPENPSNDGLKVPTLDLSNLGAAQKGHNRQKSYSKNNEMDFDNILPQNDDFGLSGAVPISAVPAMTNPTSRRTSSKDTVPKLSLDDLNGLKSTSASKTSRNNGFDKRHQSVIIDADDFPNAAKNELLANNLFGENHDTGIDTLLQDENIPQWKKQDMLFNMFDEHNYTIDESQFNDE